MSDMGFPSVTTEYGKSLGTCRYFTIMVVEIFPDFSNEYNRFHLARVLPQSPLQVTTTPIYYIHYFQYV